MLYSHNCQRSGCAEEALPERCPCSTVVGHDCRLEKCAEQALPERCPRFAIALWQMRQMSAAAAAAADYAYGHSAVAKTTVL